MSFKDQLKADMAVFFNTNEFADTHMINGKQMVIIVDTERLSERKLKDVAGTIEGDILYRVQVEEYGIEEPMPGEAQLFDGKPSTITDVALLDGEYEITIVMR